MNAFKLPVSLVDLDEDELREAHLEREHLLKEGWMHKKELLAVPDVDGAHHADDGADVQGGQHRRAQRDQGAAVLRRGCDARCSCASIPP